MALSADKCVSRSSILSEDDKVGKGSHVSQAAVPFDPAGSNVPYSMPACCAGLLCLSDELSAPTTIVSLFKRGQLVL